MEYIQNQNLFGYPNDNRRNRCRRLSDEMFRLLVDAMNEGVIIINNEGVIIYANDQFCNMQGCSDAGLVGKAIVNLVGISSWTELKAKIISCFAENNPESVQNNSIEVTWRSIHGKFIFTELSPQIISDDGNSLFFAVVTDITKSKKVKDSLIRSKLKSHHLSKQLLTAQEQERKRIAGELHDGLGQCLSAIKFKIEELVATADVDCSGLEELNVLVPLLQNATTEVRRIAMDLRPSILDDLGLKATISWLSREFRAIYPDIELETSIEIEENDLSDSLKTVLYRVIQESLNNITKHAKATHVLIRLGKEQQRLELSIVDNGIGLSSIDSSQGASDNIGLGLSSMKERVEISSGIFSINSVSGEGAEILAYWPWNPPL